MNLYHSISYKDFYTLRCWGYHQPAHLNFCMLSSTKGISYFYFIHIVSCQIKFYVGLCKYKSARILKNRDWVWPKKVLAGAQWWKPSWLSVNHNFFPCIAYFYTFRIRGFKTRNHALFNP